MWLEGHPKNQRTKIDLLEKVHQLGNEPSDRADRTESLFSNNRATVRHDDGGFSMHVQFNRPDRNKRAGQLLGGCRERKGVRREVSRNPFGPSKESPKCPGSYMCSELSSSTLEYDSISVWSLKIETAKVRRSLIHSCPLHSLEYFGSWSIGNCPTLSSSWFRNLSFDTSNIFIQKLRYFPLKFSVTS